MKINKPMSINPAPTETRTTRIVLGESSSSPFPEGMESSATTNNVTSDVPKRVTLTPVDDGVTTKRAFLRC